MTPADPAATYLKDVCHELPVTGRIIKTYGATPLSRYTQKFDMPPVQGLQSRQDLDDAVFRYIRPLLGKEVATRAASDLSRTGAVMTTTHHGIDYFANSVQGNIIYGSGILTGRLQRSTIPVFSFGNVPLNSSTFARGILIYRGKTGSPDPMPIKLPIFPDRHKRTMVSRTPAVTRQMIDRAKQRVDQLKRKDKISDATAAVLVGLLEDVYASPGVLGHAAYSAQSTAANHGIWKRLFQSRKDTPDLVSIEIEDIAAQLLKKDLMNHASTASRILFDAELRAPLVKALNGCQGCWQIKALGDRQPALARGTQFFWGTTGSGRRIPLFLTGRRLCGTDDHGNRMGIPFDRDGVIRGLEEKTLLPSLFTCFLLICFARGLTCIGGVFQGAYLTRMKTALALAFERVGDHQSARAIGRIKTDLYQDGMLALMCTGKTGTLLPAGPVEILEGGGISPADLRMIQGLTVEQAHLAGLFESVTDSGKDMSHDPQWKEKLAQSCFAQLSHSIVVKGQTVSPIF